MWDRDAALRRTPRSEPPEQRTATPLGTQEVTGEYLGTSG